MKRKIITKEQLLEQVRVSHSFTEVLRRFGYSDSYNSFKRIKRLTEAYNLDTSHFSSTFNRVKTCLIEKECPICKNKFLTKKNTHEKTYCSTRCSAIFGSQNISKEARLIMSQKAKARQALLYPKDIRECQICKTQFSVKKSDKKQFCSTSCASKFLWSNPEYKDFHSKRLKQMVKDQILGFRARTELSFPEKIWKQFLDEHGYKDRYVNNHPVKSENGNYFLDFYFPEFNLDLEIDGAQHKIPERKSHDIKRNDFLIKNRYKVYRIEWRNIKTVNGKKHLEQERQKLLDFLRGIS